MSRVKRFGRLLSILVLSAGIAMWSPLTGASGDDKGPGDSKGPSDPKSPDDNTGPSQPVDDKGGNSGPSAPDDRGRNNQGQDDRGNGEFRIFASVEQQPQGGMVGEWRIGGRTVRVTSSTRILQTSPITSGSCVEVQGPMRADGSIDATEVHIEDSGRCSGGSGGGSGSGSGSGSGGGGSDDKSGPPNFFGNLQGLPASGMRGDWKVGDKVVKVGSTVVLKQDNGPFSNGSCIEVRGTMNPDNSITAARLEVSSSSSGCGSTAALTGAELKFFGRLQSVSISGMNSDWRVGGRPVKIVPTTMLRTNNRSLTPGACVELEGRFERDGFVTATKAEVQIDDNSSCAQGVRNTEAPKLVGVVRSLPASGSKGEWKVGGHVVKVSDDTQIEREFVSLANGACVEVKGTLQADNSFLATRVETEDAARCTGLAANDDRFEHFGVIEALPDDRGAGEWRVGGRGVRVASKDHVEIEHGVPAVGSCVEVRGGLQPDGKLQATHVEVISTSGVCLFRSGAANAASFSSAAVAPGTIISLFGLNLGPASTLPMQVGADDRVLRQLGVVRVLFDGVPAPLFVVSPGQINTVVPFRVAGKKQVEVQVETNDAWSNTITLPVVSAAPAIFTATQTGRGRAAVLNVEPETGRVRVNDDANPAARGSFITLFATGMGQTEPAGEDGLIHRSTLPRPVQPVEVKIGGKHAEVSYYGAAPGLVAGVTQINLRIPDDVTPGNAVPVVLKVGDNPSRDDVTISVR